MPKKEQMHNILHAAAQAPSGDNSQPWRFEVTSDALLVFNDVEKDATLYNFRQRGSYLAHGAVLENIVIAAGGEGYKADAELFPGIPDCTMRITFDTVTAKRDALQEAIETRCTNRKPYDQTPLKPGDKEALRACARNNIHVQFSDERDAVETIANTVNLNERLLFENRPLHDFLFGMIRWTKKQEESTPGLYVKTMELPPPMRVLFRYVFRHWPVVQALNTILGMSKKIPQQTAPLYASSSAFGVVVISGDDKEDFVHAGRVLQRVWLTAERHNMALQPVAAIPYLHQRIAANEADAFTTEHIESIESAYRRISAALQLNDGDTIAMLFRIGYAELPTACSYKHPPDVKYT